MGVTTKPCEIKTLAIDFKKIEIGIEVRIPDEGEDHSDKTVDSIILYKTFPFSFMFGDKTIYGDFFIRVDEVNGERKSPFWHGMIIYNLNSFHASVDMSIKSVDYQRKIYEIKTEFEESHSIANNLIKSKVNGDNLPGNETKGIVYGKGLVDETFTNSHSWMTCKIQIYIHPKMNKATKPNLKSILCDNAIAQLENDKNFTLICDGQMFHFNKALLSLVSEVFGRMIQASNSKEALTNSVEIDDFTPDTIEAFQRVAFGNNEIKDEDLTPDLLMFAQKYLMKPLVTKIKHRLLDSLTNENIFDVIKTAYLIDDDKMFNDASDYLLKNMTQLESTEEWKIFGKNNPDCMIKTLTVMCKKGNNSIGNKN